MKLGRGRAITQPKSWQAVLWSAPAFGRRLFNCLQPFKDIDTVSLKAGNPFQLVVGQMGFGKTNLGRHQINQQIEKGLGGLVMDAKSGKESLVTYAVQRLTEVGYDPEKVFINDYFSKFGHPMQDYLYDDRKDDVSWFEIVEELVSATAQLSLLRSTPGARELSLARMSFASLMLADQPLGSISLFLLDSGFRANVVKKTNHPELERFFLGEHSYISKLPKDSLESTRNKWDILILHPAIKPCISARDTNGEFAQLKHFMQHGGWWIVPLSENRLKYELRLTLAQLAQYQLKVATLQREEMKEKPLFYCWLDEYPQYRSSITHNDLVRLARSQQVGLVFLCQDTGIFNDEEFRALAGCATIGAFNCDRSSCEDLVRQIFQPEGKTQKDWEGKTTYSIRDEIDNYISLIMQQEPGEMIARIKPGKHAYFVEVPFVPDPKVTEAQEEAFREAVAQRWYRPRKD